MKDGSLPAVMSVDSHEQTILSKMLETFIIKIPDISLERALSRMYRSHRGSKEILPRVPTPEEVRYTHYVPVVLDRAMDTEEINNLLDSKKLTHSDPLLYLAVLEEIVDMGDAKPVIHLWEDIDTGAFCHIACGMEKKGGIRNHMRYIDYGPAWKKYPAGTTVSAVQNLYLS